MWTDGPGRRTDVESKVRRGNGLVQEVSEGVSVGVFEEGTWVMFTVVLYSESPFDLT